jgi:hypothetical protein
MMEKLAQPGEGRGALVASSTICKGAEKPEPVFVNLYGAQESIPSLAESIYK